VARCIYRRLRRKKRKLFGQTIGVRIAMQGKWAKQRMFKIVEPIYRMELEHIRTMLNAHRTL
jgi:hypothetical protein